MNRHTAIIGASVIILIIIAIYFYIKNIQESNTPEIVVPVTETPTIGTVPDVNPARVNPLQNVKTNPFE